MSFYSSGQIRSELIEPVVHNENDRSEFRIRGTVLSNLKILNLGRLGTATEGNYNALTGALGGVRNVYLYDGKTLLTGMRNFNDYIAFKNVKGSNADHAEVDRFLLRHQIGYQNNYLQSETKYARKTAIKNDLNANTVPATDTSNNAERAYLQLKACMVMLQSVEVLSENVFPQLRLVIEYDSRKPRSLKKTNIAASSNCRPLLAVDRVMDEKMANQMVNEIQSFSWSEYEYDQINVTAATNGVTSLTNKRLLGFNGKFLDRMRIRKGFASASDQEAGNSVVGYGANASFNCYQEKFQVRVNGRSLFPRSGLEGSNRKLAMLHDSYGSVNIKEDDNAVLIAACPNHTDSTAGAGNHFGVAIGERIDDLQVEFSRTGKTSTAPSPHIAALNLMVEGEVIKQLSFSNGKYLISYA